MFYLSEGDLVSAILQRKKVSPDKSLATQPSIIVGAWTNPGSLTAESPLSLSHREKLTFSRAKRPLSKIYFFFFFSDSPFFIFPFTFIQSFSKDFLSSAGMSSCPNQPGGIIHPSSGMLACNSRVIGTMTPRPAALTSQALLRTFQ